MIRCLLYVLDYEVSSLNTVPLKSKLPLSRETRISSGETRLSSRETRLSSRESFKKL